jgi:hypothetical protein
LDSLGGDLASFQISSKSNNINMVNFANIHFQKFIHNQLSSPRFQKLIQFAWHKSGNLIKHPRKFPGVNEVCFKITDQICFNDWNLHNV